MGRIRSAITAASAALSLCAGGPVMAGDCSEKPNLKAAAEQTGVLSLMMEATHLAGLDDPDIKVGPLTLFAPSNEAFNALPEDFRTWLLAPENREHLAAVLMHHAIPGEYPTERLLKAKVRHYAVDAVDGTQVEVTTRRGLDIAGAKVVKADIMASDGIIHIIDKVLIPPAVLMAKARGPEPVDIAAEGDR